MKTPNNTQPELIKGPAGKLEVHCEPPRVASRGVFAVVCHPHPLHQGTMTNKVVVTIARALQKMGITTVRFNYRGVGKSEGVYDNAVGEVDDCLAVIDWTRQQFPDSSLWLAGFSFGSYVAAKAATQYPAQQLITVAPSIENMPYETLPSIRIPWLVLQGEADEVINPDAVYAFVEQADPRPTLIRFPLVGHFFHGKLVELEEVLHRELVSLNNSN